MDPKFLQWLDRYEDLRGFIDPEERPELRQFFDAGYSAEETWTTQWSADR